MSYSKGIDKTLIDRVLEDKQKASEVKNPVPGLNYKAQCPHSGDIYLIEHPYCWQEVINDKNQVVKKRRKPQLAFRYKDALKSASMHQGKSQKDKGLFL